MKAMYLTDKDTRYAPAEDECWMNLAKAIMISYGVAYSTKSPLSARSQAEYDAVDRISCAPVRKSILRNIKNGPLRNAVDIHAVYSALEQKRLDYKESLGIKWKDTYDEDLENL